MAREPKKKKGVQARQSVLLSHQIRCFEQPVRSAGLPDCFERTMKKDSSAFSHWRSGFLAAGSYILMHHRGRLLLRWAHMPIGVVSACFVPPEKAKVSANPCGLGLHSRTTGVLGLRFLAWAPSQNWRTPARELVW